MCLFLPFEMQYPNINMYSLLLLLVQKRWFEWINRLFFVCVCTTTKIEMDFNIKYMSYNALLDFLMIVECTSTCTFNAFRIWMDAFFFSRSYEIKYIYMYICLFVWPLYLHTFNNNANFYNNKILFFTPEIISNQKMSFFFLFGFYINWINSILFSQFIIQSTFHSFNFQKKLKQNNSIAIFLTESLVNKCL